MNFWKYQANGNDFVIFDDRLSLFCSAPSAHFEFICDRKRGVGADGVLFLKKSMKADFKMIYLNADGNEVSMCGNGARAITHFVHNVIQMQQTDEYIFETKNGIYHSRVGTSGKIFLDMTELYDEGAVEIKDLFPEAKSYYYANTGVPHCVFEVENVDQFDLMGSAPKMRYDTRFKEGVNINVFQVLGPSELKMRTYERGVEAETLACGTGTIAVALAYQKQYGNQKQLLIHSMGGELYVILDNEKNKREYSGEVKLVFQGKFLDPI
ncbi:MAG: diaminopimelate epimerase [Bacteriovoracaceae bacterium]|nr:diaminopimelate epimerase [Bacteriovoracaceae bacterium]